MQLCKTHCLICRYEDDFEELEWDEVFNEAPMDGKNGVRITPHSQDAKSFIDSLYTPLTRQHQYPAFSRLKRIKADPDAISSSQAMQESTAASSGSQQASFPERRPSGQAMASFTSQQSSNPRMSEMGLTGMEDDSSQGEQIPPNKRQRTSTQFRSDSQHRRHVTADALPRFNAV